MTNIFKKIYSYLRYHGRDEIIREIEKMEIEEAAWNKTEKKPESKQTTKK